MMHERQEMIIQRERSENKEAKSTITQKNMLILSLGTGAPKKLGKYSAAASSKWGIFGWVYNNGATPIIDIFTDASADMVDYHISSIFQSEHCHKNYLRIQVYF